MKNTRITIYEIKRRTVEAGIEPHFFDADTMRFFGQTLKGFSVCKCDDGRYRISTPIRVREWGKWRNVGTTVRYFNPTNNRLERE